MKQARVSDFNCFLWQPSLTCERCYDTHGKRREIVVRGRMRKRDVRERERERERGEGNCSREMEGEISIDF